MSEALSKSQKKNISSAAILSEILGGKVEPEDFDPDGEMTPSQIEAAYHYINDNQRRIKKSAEFFLNHLEDYAFDD